MLHRFGLSDPAMKDALYEMTDMREVSGLTLNDGSMPNESTNPWFWHFIKKHDLADGILYAVTQLLVDQNVMTRQSTQRGCDDH